MEERTISYKDYGFTIDTDGILLYEDGTYESITFVIIPDRDRGLLENLILNKEENGEYSSYYTAYDFTEDELEKVKQRLYVPINKAFMCRLYDIEASGLMSRGGGDQIYMENGKCYKDILVRVESYSNIPGQLESSRWVWQ